VRSRAEGWAALRSPGSRSHRHVPIGREEYGRWNWWTRAPLARLLRILPPQAAEA
jgi:hypothetical protein